jgi:hypothetical protein
MLIAHILQAFDQTRHSKLLSSKTYIQELKSKGFMLKYGMFSSPPNTGITVTNLTISYLSLQKLFSL